MSTVNQDINLNSLLEEIKKYEVGIIKRIDHFVDLYDKQEKEDYIWRCVELLRNEDFIDGIDIIHNYLNEMRLNENPFPRSWSYDFMENVIQTIYGTDDFDTYPINGRYFGSCKEYDKDKVKALFDEHGDYIIKLTHYMWFEELWWDNIEHLFDEFDLIKGEKLKQNINNFISYYKKYFPDKCVFDTSFIKTGPNDYYEIKINGFDVNDIDYIDGLGYKNKYCITIDFSYNDFTFIYHDKIDSEQTK